jgi:hypothetical protein
VVRPRSAPQEAARPRPGDGSVPLPALRDITGPLPVYRKTVASLRWDPASGQPGAAGPDGTHHREKP